jgi:hypothetical protein
MAMIGYGTRVRFMAIGGLAGWLAGFIAALPAEIFIGMRDAGGEPKLLAATLSMGLGVWAIWTLLLAVAAWLIFAVPCALMASPEWMVRFRVRLLIGVGLVALLTVFIKLWSFQDRAASTAALRFILYVPYGCFAVVFSVVTAWLYMRLARGRLFPSPADEAGKIPGRPID